MYFIKARESRNEWWRYLIVLSSVLGIQLIGSVPVIVIVALKKLQGNMHLEEFSKTLDFEKIGISQNWGLILLLIPSVLSFFGLLLMIIHFHKKKLGEVASSSGKIRWNHIWTGLLVWLILLIIGELAASWVHPGNYVFHTDLNKFIPLLVIALLLIPFQAAFEELLFRSYLILGAGLLFKFRIIALVLTSAAFGFMHGMNPEVKEFGLMNSMLYYIGFGLFAGLLVIMEDGIELAIGVHAINNIYGAVFVTYESSALQTPALLKMKTLDPVFMNVVFFVMAIVFLIIISRKYRWTDWQKIFRRIG